MATAKKDVKNSPACPSAIHAKLSPSWKITQDLWGSALDIRGLETEYLPKFKKEPDEKYRERLDNSVFENEFRLAIETMAGTVFRTDPKPDELPEQIDTMFTDIDLCGNSFWSFALNAFEKFLRDGNGFIYIDAPPLSEDAKKKVEDGAKLTLADRKGDRPFWVFYEASQLVNYRYEKIGSREIFSQMTFRETTMVPDGDFGEKEVTRYRVLQPGKYTVYGQNETTKEFDVIAEESGTTGLTEIPVIPIADLDTVPPLLTLGLLNLLYYRKTSDFDNICHLVCTPLRVQKYGSKEDAEAAAKIQTASAAAGLKGWGPDFNVFFAEVEGKGMDIARSRYQDVAANMTRIGTGMMAPADTTAIRTATEVIDSAGQRQSKLARLARDFENAIEKALYVTAEVYNAIFGAKTIDLAATEDKTKLKLKIDYDRLTFTMEQVGFFSDLVDSGKLTLLTFLTWLSDAYDMPPGFDPQKEVKDLANANVIETAPPEKDDLPPKQEER
mgnify:CR=1 FL=1